MHNFKKRKMTIESFNIKYPVGSTVKVKIDGTILEAKVQYPANILRGNEVVWLEHPDFSGANFLSQIINK